METRWWFHFFFNPYLGKWSNLTSIFFNWGETTLGNCCLFDRSEARPFGKTHCEGRGPRKTVPGLADTPFVWEHLSLFVGQGRLVPTKKDILCCIDLQTVLYFMKKEWTHLVFTDTLVNNFQTCWIFRICWPLYFLTPPESCWRQIKTHSVSILALYSKFQTDFRGLLLNLSEDFWRWKPPPTQKKIKKKYFTSSDPHHDISIQPR